MSNHTLGPWKFEYGCVYNTGGVRIALMDRQEPATLPTERDANARLIVRACNSHKELLDACLSIISAYEGERGISDSDIGTVRAAIAKAQGE